MFLTQWLNRDYTDDERLYQTIGLPKIKRDRRGSTAEVTLDEEGGNSRTVLLSKHATSKWSNLRREEITHFTGSYSYSRRVTYGRDEIGSVMFVLCMVFAIFSGAFFLQNGVGFFLGILLALILGALPNELWTLYAVSRLKLITRLTKDGVKEKFDVILAENERDLELKAETEELIKAYKARLTASDITCSEEARITPETEGSWRVVDVQYHNIGDSPFDRDATITLTSDEHDGVTCVLPGEDTVKAWLDGQLKEMRSRVKPDTHTYVMLEGLRAKHILHDVWEPPSQVLAEVAKMVTSSKQPFSERAAVTLHGKRLSNGHVMAQALGFADADGSPRELMFAPTEPVVQLTAAVEAQLLETGEHPALLNEVPKAA